MNPITAPKPSEAPPPKPQLLPQKKQLGSSASLGHVRLVAGTPSVPPATHKRVLQLYAAYEQAQEAGEMAKERSRVAPLSSSLALVQRRPATAGAIAVRQSSFIQVLKAHYPLADKQTVDAMLAAVKPSIDAADRRRWIRRVRASQGDQLRMAFESADVNGDGGISLKEFLAAVTEAARAANAGVTRGGGARAALAAEGDTSLTSSLEALFLAADTDGNGTLDFDEFLAMCASQPTLVACFDAIIEAGVRRVRKREDARFSTLFRFPVSPASRKIRSPSSGMSFRPTLYDLRRTDEVQELTVRHATSSRW